MNMEGIGPKLSHLIGFILCYGTGIDHETVQAMVLGFRRTPFNLTEKYMRYKLIPKLLQDLMDRGILNERNGIYSVTSSLMATFAGDYADVLQECHTHVSKFRGERVLEISLADADELLESLPDRLADRIKGAIRIYRETDQYDAVLTKCGQCAEIMASEINKKYKLVDSETPSYIIGKLPELETIKSFPDAENKDLYRAVSYGLYALYRYRSIFGAHVGPEIWWGDKQLALSAILWMLSLASLAQQLDVCWAPWLV